ncbi:MAG: hypothetical protein E7368_00570 [Clostridiales bacterium]|nr:hypothetical protein [Clostridiales bacterium]
MQKSRKNRHVYALTLLVGVFFICPHFSVSQGIAEESPMSKWQKLASYTTYYNEGDRDRSENISIASSLINDVVLQAYGEFSFNQTVGRRTADAGFKQAKIIVNGEYVLGVGGGVCQVSTTLYNSAILSGLEVTEFHPHSLLVGYVAPSRDAMVSTHSDLKLYNPHDYPVRLRSQTFSGGITVGFYSECKIDKYALVSVKTGETLPPPPVVKEGEEEGILRQERNGVKSELYLERYKKGKLISRKRIRKDEYRPTQGIIVKKIGNPPD